ncbi:hypothetical protein CRG98_012204 [Punica granatum]|uniref:Uncharacterized protein n=1 Tax=Punica granatum TaxID=22663 RepID=A0A2I0KFZ8_PUNGR|nr:hypothetical protein CRG98_012204 [Punica granatum]
MPSSMSTTTTTTRWRVLTDGATILRQGSFTIYIVAAVVIDEVGRILGISVVNWICCKQRVSHIGLNRPWAIFDTAQDICHLLTPSLCYFVSIVQENELSHFREIPNRMFVGLSKAVLTDFQRRKVVMASWEKERSPSSADFKVDIVNLSVNREETKDGSLDLVRNACHQGPYQWMELRENVIRLGLLAASLCTYLFLLKPQGCGKVGELCQPHCPLEVALFYISIYLVAIGFGAPEPSLATFGVDQFDREDPDEQQSKSSFYSYYYVAVNMGCLVAQTVLSTSKIWAIGWLCFGFALEQPWSLWGSWSSGDWPWRVIAERRRALSTYSGRLPSTCLWGVSEAFTYVAQMEFFSSLSPDQLKSIGIGLCLSSSAVRSYVCSITLSVVTNVTSRNGKHGWVPPNLNDGHLDRFFFLSDAIVTLNLGFFVIGTKWYNSIT